MKLPDIDLSDELVTPPFMQEHALIFDVNPFQRAYAYAKLVVMMGWGFGFLPYSTGGGKTAFSRYFVENLRADYWRLPVYRVVAKQAVQSATRAFPLRLCAAVGYKLASQVRNGHVRALNNPPKKIVVPPPPDESKK